MATIWLTGAVSLAACAPPPMLPPPDSVPAPDPSSIEHVIFLVGDAGEATRDAYPVLRRLEQDIEWWAQRLPGDSAVTVLFLGDIVYPLGLHPPDHEAYPSDSTIVAHQVRLLQGQFARERGARGYFLAGNHDWGLETEWDGFVRLKQLDEFLKRAAEETGAGVQLAPEAGTGGPYVVDVGRNSRLLLLDTAWWLLDGGQIADPQHTAVLSDIEEAMQTAGDRHVFIAAHHPFRSAGPHGGEFDFWKTFGVRYLLARSGAILQDITSVPYRELESGLRAVFSRQEPPLAFLGGHEHSLQVFGAIKPDEPTYTLVSGSASKLSSVGRAEGMYFGRSQPGYMRVLIENDGGVTVFVEAAPREYHICSGSLEERQQCVGEGVAAYEVIHSQRLH